MTVNLFSIAREKNYPTHLTSFLVYGEVLLKFAPKYVHFSTVFIHPPIGLLSLLPHSLS